jgi:GR25 family glycosyltransferase involved in LPS biosynthesis
MEANVTEEMMKLLLPMNEDIFFSHACELLNKRVPDTFHRSYFAVEADANPETAGYHGWDKEHHPVDIAIMLLTKSEFWNQRIAQCNMNYYLHTQGQSQTPISDIRMPPPPHQQMHTPINQSYMPPMRPIQHQASEIRIEPLSPPSNCNLSSFAIPYKGGMGVSFSGTICTASSASIACPGLPFGTKEARPSWSTDNQRVVSPTIATPSTVTTPIGVQPLNNHVLAGLTQMYYINLDRCTQRREYMEKLVKHPMFSGVNVERISACDGSRDNIDDFLEFELPFEKSSEVTSLEYACTISHFRAIEAFSMTDSSKVPFALIVEDDLSMDFVPHWKHTLQEYMDQCPHEWEVLQLSYIPVEAAIDRRIEYDAWNITKNICGATAYLMTHAAASKFMTNIKSQYYSNKYCIGPNTRGIVTYKADWLIYSLMRTYTVNPPLFTYRDQNDSNIHPEHVIHQAAAKNRTQELFR